MLYGYKTYGRDLRLKGSETVTSWDMQNGYMLYAIGRKLDD